MSILVPRCQPYLVFFKISFLRGITLTHIQDRDDQMAAKSKTQVIPPGLPTTLEKIT